MLRKRTIEEEQQDNHHHPKTIRMSAATEASLDDIVHSYGRIQAIKMTGDNTPSHVIDAYKELLNVRRSHGEFDESFHNLSECDLATTKSINKDVFHFLQSIVNDWNHDLDDHHHVPQFGARQTTRIGGFVVNSVVIPTAVKTNQFQCHYEKLLRNVKKHVDKNVKIKKSMSCNCTTTMHQINDSFFLVSICEGNSTTKTFIIMWFIDCCMTMNDSILCCDNNAMPSDYQKWSLYEGCHGNDSICSDMYNCEKMLTDAWPIHCDPCIINLPEEFSNLELSKKCDIIILNKQRNTPQ